MGPVRISVVLSGTSADRIADGSSRMTASESAVLADLPATDLERRNARNVRMRQSPTTSQGLCSGNDGVATAKFQPARQLAIAYS